LVTLHVDPAGLAGLAVAVGRAAEDAHATRAYYEKHGDIGWAGDGLINLCRGSDEKMQRDVRAFLGRLSNEVLPGVSAGVTAAREYYLRADQAGADRLDATMPALDPFPARRSVDPVPVGPGSRQRAAFADIVEPTAHHTEPPDFDTRMPFEPKWHDIASVGALVRDAFWAVTWAASQLGMTDRPYDLYEIALKPICGDWAGMARVGYALERAGESVGDVSTNLVWAAQCTPGAWGGNAADAATANLYAAARALADARVAMTRMGQEYASAAQGAFNFSDTIGSLLVDASDAAVTAAVAAGLTAAAGSSVVGAPVALIIGVFFASEVFKVVRTCREIVQIIGKLDALTSSLKSSGDQFGAIDGDYPLPALPAAPVLPR
jgi:hypothetical protein